VLLPVGESAEFRIHKDRLLLRVPEADGKEREYTVVSTQRLEACGLRQALAIARANGAPVRFCFFTI
jgi:hypothetical protein